MVVFTGPKAHKDKGQTSPLKKVTKREREGEGGKERCIKLTFSTEGDLQYIYNHKTGKKTFKSLSISRFIFELTKVQLPLCLS